MNDPCNFSGDPGLFVLGGAGFGGWAATVRFQAFHFGHFTKNMPRKYNQQFWAIPAELLDIFFRMALIPLASGEHEVNLI